MPKPVRQENASPQGCKTTTAARRTDTGTVHELHRMGACDGHKGAKLPCKNPRCCCHSRRRRTECVGIEMKQYRMQNRYTNHLPSHFYCRHGIDLNLSCSLCINEECQTRALAERQPPMPSIGAPRNTGTTRQVIRLERRKELRQTRPLAIGDDAGRSDAGDA